MYKFYIYNIFNCISKQVLMYDLKYVTTFKKHKYLNLGTEPTPIQSWQFRNGKVQIINVYNNTVNNGV